MKKLTIPVCVLAIALGAVPVLASVPSEGKDDCLLYGKNCPNVLDNLPTRIAKLKQEIEKGEKVYSSVELIKLKKMLKEDNETMRVLHKPGR